jgi:hypothetical protein
LRNHEVRARDGVLAKHELESIRNRLTSTDRPRLLLLWRLCEQAGLVGRENRLWQPTQAAAAWLKEDAPSRQRALFQAWLSDADWNELCAMPSVRCEDTGWRHDPILPRRALLAHLRECPLNVWLDVESLIDAIYDTAPDFMRPDGDYESWYIRDARNGHYLLGFASWGSVEGALIRYLLEQPLLQLGAVSVGHAQPSARPTAFRLTAIGEALLLDVETPPGGEDAVRSQQPAERVELRSDLSVLVPIRGNWYDRFLVERFARWVEEHEGIARYEIDRNSVARAASAGVSIPQIEAFLRRVSGGRVPARVHRALEAWGA